MRGEYCSSVYERGFISRRFPVQIPRIATIYLLEKKCKECASVPVHDA